MAPPAAGPLRTSSSQPPAGSTTPAGSASTSASTGASTAASTVGATAEAEVVRLTNAERAKAGCGPLHSDSRLTTAAAAHSVDMANRGYFSHTTPEGKTPWDRARAAGYPDPSAENIAMGYRTAADVVAGWMGSEGHRANILNCSSHAVGVGFDARGNYWTQLFGYV